MKRILCAAVSALVLAAVLCGCVSSSQSDGSGESVNIWRVRADGQDGELLQAQVCALGGGTQAEPDEALALFLSVPRSDALQSALPETVELLSWTSQSGLVTLSLSDGFLELSAMEQSTAAAAAALTLCQLDEVDAVSIAVGGETLFRAISADDVLFADTDSDPYTRRLRLYFASEDGQWLESEYHSLSLDDDSDLERYVMEELLRGPNDAQLRSAVPEGTELLSCRTENGVCTVDLSAEFVENKPDTALGERLAVWSIVNSLTTLADVDSVCILCQGESVDTYVYRSLSEPLRFLAAAVGPPSAARGEQAASLYLALPGLEQFVAVPCVLAVDEQDDAVWALLAALAESDEPGLPQLFSGAGTIVSSRVSGSVRVVEVSESFFASLEVDERMAAVKSLAATVLAFGSEKSVRITLGGEDAVFEAVSYAGVWSADDINIVE